MQCSKNWRQAVGDELISASGRPEEAFQWVLESEMCSATYACMADSGAFLTLDMKLAAAISAHCTGEIGRQLTMRKADERKNGVMVKGRQLLYMIGEYYRANEEAGAMYDMADLMGVKIRGDNLENFLNTWDMVVMGMRSEATEECMRVLFHENIRKCGFLR